MTHIMKHFYKEIEGFFSWPNLYSHIVKSFGDNAKFVEVGTWLGQSTSYMAVEIANSNKNIQFFCVDTFLGSQEHQEGDEKYKEIVKDGGFFDKFCDNLAPVSEYIIPMRMTSLEASRHFKDESLDFVFIDASHDYENVKQDILHWYPKVKHGGCIGGHDYHPDWPDVVKAVDEFAGQMGNLVFNGELCWVIEKNHFRIPFKFTEE